MSDLTTDQEALRDEIARALRCRRIGVYKSGLVQDAPIPSEDARFLASAVLPIVTRREAAMVEKINALADQLDDDRRGAIRDVARRLRGLVSGDNQAVRDGD